MSSSLEERLKNHSHAFDGLLSLIPAKYYYDEETKDQWKKQKSSKEEKKQQRKDKLSSETPSTAAAVAEERAKNAKPVAYPSKLNKNKKTEAAAPAAKEDTTNDEVKEVNEEEDQESDSDEEVFNDMDVDSDLLEEDDEEDKEESTKTELVQEDEEEQAIFDDEGNEIEISSSSTTTTTTTTITTSAAVEEKPKKTSAVLELREKLATRIQSLRERRKAPGSTNASPASRAALLEVRRIRDEARREFNLKKKAREEAAAASANTALSIPGTKPEATADEGQILFSKVVFDDGKEATSDLTEIKREKKKRTRDVETQLKFIEAKKAKISGYDDEKRKKIEEKNKWSKAIKLSEGEKVKDDEKMLRKSLKKQKKQKRKSEVAWGERKETVTKHFANKDKKRTENLQKRKDQKGIRGKKNKKRAGFEGGGKKKGSRDRS